MRLLWYELKKLFGQRYLLILLALMTVACSGLYYYLYAAGGNGVPPTFDRERDEILDDFYREYNSAPERIESIREEYIEYREKADQKEEEILAGLSSEEKVGFVIDDAILAGYGIKYENKLGYYRSDGTPVDDSFLFEDLSYNDRVIEGISRRLDEIIDVTEGAMMRYEAVAATNLPVYEYERHFNERYTALRDNITVQPANIHGWDRIFFYDEFGIFVYAYLILAAGVVFLHERSAGLLHIIRTTRGGRIKTTAAKLGALSIISVFVVLVFSAGVYITAEAVFGLSPADAAIQHIFRNCPYRMTIGGYAAVLTLIRCLCAVAFSCVITLVAALSFSPVVTYTSGAVILIANVFINFYTTSSDWTLVNIISMSTDEAMSHYGEILLFGHYASTFTVGIVIYTCIALLAGTLFVVVGGRRNFVPTPSDTRRINKLLNSVKTRILTCAETIRSHGVRKYPSSLFSWECGKLLTPRILAIILVLAAASGYEAYLSYHEKAPTAQIQYETYVNENFFGELGEKKRSYIESHTVEVKSLINDETMQEMIERYKLAEITWEEYEEFLDLRDAAKKEAALLDEVNEQVRYIDRLEAETGVRGWLFEDIGVFRILSRDINIFLFAAVVVVFARIYTADFSGKVSEGNFSSILRTTRLGRRASYRSKMLAALVISFTLAIIFSIVDILIGISVSERFFEVLSAPIASMEYYEAMRGGITVGGYIVVIIALRCVGCVMLALLTSSASYLVKKVPPTLFFVAAFTLLPYVLVYMGVLNLRYIDFTAIIAGGKLLTRSASFAVFGGTFTFAILIVAGYGLLTAASTLYIRACTGK